MARPQKFRLSPDDVLDPQNARKLAGHVAEIEFFRAEVEKLQGQIAGVYDAADEEGFDKKFIRKVVAIRAKDETVAQAEQAGIEAYTEALEIGFRSRARVENVRHDADGVVIEDDEIPGNGAGGAEDEASVAAVRAPSSAQPIPPETADTPERSVFTPADAPSSEAAEGNEAVLAAPEPIPEPEAQGSSSSPAASVSGDEGTVLPAAALVATQSNVTTLRTHNPATHFLNSTGLVRLHGCLKPELCGAAEPRKKLCFGCSVQHDGPSSQTEGGAA